MGQRRQFGKDLTNTKGLNAPGPSNQHLVELKMDTEKPLKKDQAICPICYSVILEPVTLPCNHNVCRPCFDIHIWKTSINCPICRRRLSVWCRKAVKENSVVNLKLQKQIENQFPLQVAAQKEKLKLPEEERKLDHVLVEFLKDDSPRLPPRKFAKTGEIAKEFNEMFSKHLEDVHRAEESATVDFIAKFLSPKEKEAIRNLEKNLMLGEGLKEKNEQSLGDGTKVIKLRARPVKVGDLKISPDISKPKTSKLKSTKDSPMSPEPAVSPSASTAAEPGMSIIFANLADSQPAQDFHHQADVSLGQLTATCARDLNGISSRTLQDLHRAEESASDALIAKCVTPEEQETIRNPEENLKLDEALKQENERCLRNGANLIKLCARPVQAADLKSSPDDSKPKKSKLKPTRDSLMSPEPSVSPKTSTSGLQFEAPIPANQAGPQLAQDFHCHGKVSPDQFMAPSGPLRQADTYTTKRGHFGLICQVFEDHNYFQPTLSSSKKVKEDYELEATSDSLMSPKPSVSPKIQPRQSPICANQADLEPAQDFHHHLKAQCDKEFNEILSEPLQDHHLAEESASEAFIAKCLTPKQKKTIRNVKISLILGERLKEKHEDCLGESANVKKIRARPVKALDLKISPHNSKPKKTKLKASSNSLMSLKPSNLHGHQITQVSSTPVSGFSRIYLTSSEPCIKNMASSKKNSPIHKLVQQPSPLCSKLSNNHLQHG